MLFHLFYEPTEKPYWVINHLEILDYRLCAYFFFGKDLLFLDVQDIFGNMQLTRSSKENEDKKATSNPGDPFEKIQVHRAAWALQEAIIPRCLPTRAKTQRYSRGCRGRVFLIRCSSPCRKWAQPRTLCQPREKSQSLAIL